MNLLEFVEFEEQIGRIWHRLIGTGSVTAGYHHYPDAAVSLEDIRVALGVFFRGLGGSPGIAITTGTQRASGHRLKLRQRLGLMAELVSPIECNHERMLLPEILGYFPDKELNRQHYFWLVAFFPVHKNMLMAILNLSINPATHYKPIWLIFITFFESAAKYVNDTPD